MLCFISEDSEENNDRYAADLLLEGARVSNVMGEVWNEIMFGIEGAEEWIRDSMSFEERNGGCQIKVAGRIEEAETLGGTIKIERRIEKSQKAGLNFSKDSACVPLWRKLQSSFAK